jgi:uncharacterized protein
LKRVLQTGFGKGGIGRNVLRPWAGFFRPGYHPWDQDDRVLLAQGEADLATISAKRAGYARDAVKPVVEYELTTVAA